MLFQRSRLESTLSSRDLLLPLESGSKLNTVQIRMCYKAHPYLHGILYIRGYSEQPRIQRIMKRQRCNAPLPCGILGFAPEDPTRCTGIIPVHRGTRKLDFLVANSLKSIVLKGQYKRMLLNCVQLNQLYAFFTAYFAVNSVRSIFCMTCRIMCTTPPVLYGYAILYNPTPDLSLQNASIRRHSLGVAREATFSPRYRGRGRGRARGPGEAGDFQMHIMRLLDTLTFRLMLWTASCTHSSHVHEFSFSSTSHVVHLKQAHSKQNTHDIGLV